MIRTVTRTHAEITFANPYLACDHCHQLITGWHDDDRCGCGDDFWNLPCGHKGATSVCPSWGPVDGCSCLELLGHMPHAQVA